MLICSDGVRFPLTKVAFCSGFLLDGGVHHAAGLRLLLGPDNPLVFLSAFTVQLQEHLPPVDTISAIANAKDGAVGTISISFGTSYKTQEWSVASEKSIVSVSRDQVTTERRCRR
jgi:predicted dehydrogenase